MLFAMWAERRYARQASRELLELLQLERHEHPERSGRSLYQAVVSRRLGPNAARAAEVVLHAEESFIDWPVERELRFRDVVHYLIFDEYTRRSATSEATRTNIGDVVARIIPESI